LQAQDKDRKLGKTNPSRQEFCCNVVKL